MTSSPFHGIFSALGHGNLKRSLSPSPEDDAMPKEEELLQKQPSVGKVAVDIYEHEDYYIIKAPIAGVRLSDLDIEINENILTIRGNRRQSDSIRPEQYYLQECFWGPFSRSITLPCIIDPKKVKATFNKECILKILVQKEEKVKIVRISEA